MPRSKEDMEDISLNGMSYECLWDECLDLMEARDAALTALKEAVNELKDARRIIAERDAEIRNRKVTMC